MENTFTFEQPKSQGNVLWIIFGAVALMMGGLFLIFWLLDPDGPWTFPVSMVWIGAVMAGVYLKAKRIAKWKFTMVVGENGFSVVDEELGKRAEFRWEEVSKYRKGNLSASSIEKEYLWIWLKGKHPNLYIEVFESDATKLEKFKEFRQLACHYLAQSQRTPTQENPAQA